MARRCFKISKLIFNFHFLRDQDGEIKFVEEVLEEYLKKYASNTKITNVVVLDEINERLIEFSKKISTNTINNILGQMLTDGETYQMLYNGKDQSIKIMLLK